MTKAELQMSMRKFFGTENKLEDATDADDKSVDYSYAFTTGERNSTRCFIDVEIFYLKMRNRYLLITHTELLDYQP